MDTVDADSSSSGSEAPVAALRVAAVSKTRSISALIALLGSLLAVVIPATTAIVEFYKTRRELALESYKNSRELALKDKELEENITLECLKLVVSKDTAASDRRQVLQAIITFDTPLQGWAKDRLTELDQDASAADLRTAEIQQRFSTADKRSVKTVVAAETVNVLQQKISQDKDNPVELNKDWQLLIAAKASALELSGGHEVAVVVGAGAGGAAKGKPTPVSAVGPGESVLTAKEVTVAEVEMIFPNAPVTNIEKNLPLVLSALKQFKMMDRTMVLVTLAAIKTEAQTFTPLVESPSKFNTSAGGAPFDLYDNRRGLGNTGPPDGERFRGRGYLQLTGRAGYAHLSSELGLGNALVETPEKAADPQIAAQLLVLYLKQYEGEIRQAAEQGDFAAIRKRMVGGNNGLDRFTEAYKAGDKALPR